MARSDAETVEEYLDELPEPRRNVVSTVRDVILEHLPDGYEEAMNWGMITYQVPLERYPDTYNGQPLMYAALAAQKRHFGLYLMCVYQHGGSGTGGVDRDWLADAFAEHGTKLDMGKSCVRFRSLEDLPLGVVAEVIASEPVDRFIESYETVRGER